MPDNKDILRILDFVADHPESTVSRQICRETLGEAPSRITGDVMKRLRHKLEAADELVVEGYSYLVR